jgi:hypothetical protein
MMLDRNISVKGCPSITAVRAIPKMRGDADSGAKIGEHSSGNRGRGAVVVDHRQWAKATYDSIGT